MCIVYHYDTLYTCAPPQRGGGRLALVPDYPDIETSKAVLHKVSLTSNGEKPCYIKYHHAILAGFLADGGKSFKHYFNYRGVEK